MTKKVISSNKDFTSTAFSFTLINLKLIPEKQLGLVQAKLYLKQIFLFDGKNSLKNCKSVKYIQIFVI